MKIALIGYGKMGKMIESLAIERGHEVVFRGNSSNQSWKQFSYRPDWDCAIEFTNPESVVDNLEKLLHLGVPTVCGSTGWNHELERIQNLVREKNGTFITASNFSVGVNIFLAVNRQLAKLMNAQTDYQVKIQEIHHTEKKDAPSGTAISTAEVILREIDRLERWDMASNEVKPDSLQIESLRLSDVPGTHTVTYNSNIDSIIFTHQAHNRKGFALGAILAAEFIHGKRGIFTIEEVLNMQND
jgi:4-hydroxy-tetrahydrodipicolinate reductase